MQRIFSFGTGNFWKWAEYGEDFHDKIIAYCRCLDISGIELFISFPEEMRNISISEDNLSWIRSLDYVSLHAPPRIFSADMHYKQKAGLLEGLFEIYKKINAKTVVIHPRNLPSKEIFDTFGMHVSFENLSPRSGLSKDALTEIFKKHPKAGFCLDVSHAFLWSPEETHNLINEFNSRISQVHFSGTAAGNCHISINQASREFMRSIEPVRALPCPIVIEQEMQVNDIELVKRELELIKGFFA